MATAVSPQTDKPDDFEETAQHLVHLDPALLVRDECNAREHDTEPDTKLISSVKELGVEEVISVRPNPDGTYGVFKGWRRAQAAQIANATAEQDGRPVRTVKAFVCADLVGRDGWTRFLSLVENDHRQEMDARDTLKAQELSLVGMDEVDQARAVKAMGLKRGAVNHLRKAQKLNDAVLRQATAGGMDLEQTAQLTEVEGISNATHRLLRALAKDQEEGRGGRGHWDQEFALLMEEQASAKARADATAALQESGVALLSSLPREQRQSAKPLTDLTTGLGAPLTADNHHGCHGHCATLDEDNQPVWHCADPAASGHKVRKQPKPPRSAEDEAEAAEKSAERARVVACNRAWKAAAGPRQQFISRLVKGKSLPDEARTFAQQVLLELPEFYGKWASKGNTADVARFLGAKEGEDATAAELAAALPKAKLANVLFAQVAAAFEADIRDPKTYDMARYQPAYLWEAPSPQQAAYLLLLEALGQADNGSYALSEVEDQAVAKHRPKTPDAA
ncbi:ParB N-terminal domain-containing protein [Streptomyces sp. AC555_RSS877]|uniref:ParB/RepB/Spo0J family partition protein n=1 Tax=Streptomyces sp. AC555_RSS877 TaxID=2823688 RepID=UPI001C27A074|nr:ParB N-terminal domain-containing protein [Streptomyces sp. AC555_RSS877]